MSLRFKHIDEQNRRAAAELAARKVSCEGCFWLARHPRPMCRGETSPHYRTARESYHERCHAFSVTGAMPVIDNPKREERRARKEVIRR